MVRGPPDLSPAPDADEGMSVRKQGEPRGHPVQRVVEDRPDAVAHPRVRHQLGPGQARDRPAQEGDPCERIGLAREKQHRAADAFEVVGAFLPLFRMTGPMERVREENEAGRRLLRGKKAGNAPAEGVTADHGVCRTADRRAVGGHRAVRAPTRQHHSLRLDATRAQAVKLGTKPGDRP